MVMEPDLQAQMSREEMVERLGFDWEPEWKPSWLSLKEHGPNKAIVVRIAPGAILGRTMHRIYDGYLNGQKVHDAASQFSPGQVLDVR